MSEIEIKILDSDEVNIQAIASWLFNEWGRHIQGRTLEQVLERIRERVLSSTIPLTVIATENGTPIGTASLASEDLDSHKHLTPWLASVYVVPEFRKNGVGSKLCKKIVKEAKRIGIRDLYLFTPDKADFYRHLGWIEIDKSKDKNKEVVVMKYTTSLTII